VTRLWLPRHYRSPVLYAVKPRLGLGGLPLLNASGETVVPAIGEPGTPCDDCCSLPLCAPDAIITQTSGDGCRVVDFSIELPFPGCDCDVEWDFGDGNGASGLTASHEYDCGDSGPFTVTANIECADGSTASPTATAAACDPCITDCCDCLDEVVGVRAEVSGFYDCSINPWPFGGGGYYEWKGTYFNQTFNLTTLLADVYVPGTDRYKNFGLTLGDPDVCEDGPLIEIRNFPGVIVYTRHVVSLFATVGCNASNPCPATGLYVHLSANTRTWRDQTLTGGTTCAAPSSSGDGQFGLTGATGWAVTQDGCTGKSHTFTTTPLSNPCTGAPSSVDNTYKVSLLF
jgi:hypothetical protein